MRTICLILLSLILSTSTFALTDEKDSYTYTEEHLSITVTSEHPQFSIKLKSNPSTGYSWFLRGYDANLIQPVKHNFVPAADRKLVGAPGFEVWTFKVKPEGFDVPQQSQIRFVYARPWETVDQSNQVVFMISTLSLPESSGKAE